MNRLAIGLALTSVIIVVAFAVIDAPPPGRPLITIGQGVSHDTIGDREVFIVRNGSVIEVIPRSSKATDGESIVWCPHEEAFVAPESTSLWTMRGEWVAGPAETDLDRLESSVQADLTLVVDPNKIIRAAGRSSGEISGEAGERYSRFRAGDAFARFCQNPVPPAPEAVATPTPASS